MDNKMLTFSSEIKGIDEKEQTLTAYVSTGARDRMDEVLLPGGADMKNYKKNPIVLFAHKYDEPPIGKALWIKNDGDGILAKVKFASTAFAQEIFSLFKEGIMNAFSVGFVPKEWEDGDGKKKASRTYTKWEMLEFSAVPVPCNPEALQLAMSKGLIKTESLKKELGIDEPKMEEVSAEEVEPKDYMEDIKAMQSEIEQNKKDLEANLALQESLKKEISDLRYQIYTLKHKPIPAPEISGEAIAKIISETISGEIRRATGKV